MLPMIYSKGLNVANDLSQLIVEVVCCDQVESLSFAQVLSIRKWVSHRAASKVQTNTGLEDGQTADVVSVEENSVVTCQQS